MSNIQILACSNEGIQPYPYVYYESKDDWFSIVTPENINVLPKYGSWMTVGSSKSGYTLVMCNNDGFIYVSIDGGKNWVKQTVSTTNGDNTDNWLSCDISDDGNTIVVTSRLFIYIGDIGIIPGSEADYTWTPYSATGDLGFSKPVNFSACTISGDEKTIYVVNKEPNRGDLECMVKLEYDVKDDDYNPTIILSNQFDIEPLLNWTSISTNVNGTIIVAADNNNYLYISMDSGVSWIAQQNIDSINSSDKLNWFCVDIDNNGTNIIACGPLTNKIYLATYEIGGWTWEDTSMPDISPSDVEKENFFNVACSTDFLNLAVSIRGGSIYISENSGTTWEKEISQPDFIGTSQWTSLSIALEQEAVCVRGTSNILMADGTLKKIQDIKRGDLVLNDKMKGESNKVARVVKTYFSGAVTKLPKGLLGAINDIIITNGHPVWVDNDKKRVRSKNILGSTLKKTSEFFYNIQYEDEGTYYAENVKMDSLPPNSKQQKLPKNLFFDQSKYDESYIIELEDDSRREKPKMLKTFTPI